MESGAAPTGSCLNGEVAVVPGLDWKDLGGHVIQLTLREGTELVQAHTAA